MCEFRFFAPVSLAWALRAAQTRWAAQAVRANLPPTERLLYYGGLGVMATVGVLEWPVAAAVGVGVWLAGRAGARSPGAGRLGVSSLHGGRSAMAPAVRRTTGSRHAWAHDGHAHIAVRRIVAGEPAVDFAACVEKALEATDGVSWAAYNGALSRVVVSFDPARITLAVLVEEVRRVERQVDAAGRRVPMPDIDPSVANLAALGADLLGIGGGLTGRLMRLPRLPAELAALTAAVDVLPRLGKRLQTSLGTVGADLGVALMSSAIGAASQTVASSAADAALRILLLAETAAHRDALSRRADDLFRDAETSRADPVEQAARPAPLPDGPIERYAQRIGMVTLLAAGALLPLPGGRRRAARAIAVGSPRAARLGREAYAGQLGRVLARRGVVARDPAALRRLDRIDTVVVDAPVLMTGRSVVSQVVPMRGSADEARDRAAWLLSDGGPSGGPWRAPLKRGGWALSTPSRLGTPVPEEVAASMDGNGSGRGDVLALTHRGTLVALLRVEAELDPLGAALLAAARKVGRVLIAGATPALLQRVQCGRHGRGRFPTRRLRACLAAQGRRRGPRCHPQRRRVGCR